MQTSLAQLYYWFYDSPLYELKQANRYFVNVMPVQEAGCY